MTIQDWGAIGELVGGIAVIITLIYLAVQVRQNTQMNASLIRQHFYDATQQQILHAVESPHFNSVIHRGWTTDEELQAGEQTTVWRHMQGILMGYYAAFEQHKTGALPEQDWALARVILRSFWLMDGAAKNMAWTTMYEGGVFPQDFLDEVQALREDALAYKNRIDEQDLQMI